jgi:hypothetical protein
MQAYDEAELQSREEIAAAIEKRDKTRAHLNAAWQAGLEKAAVNIPRTRLSPRSQASCRRSAAPSSPS